MIHLRWGPTNPQAGDYPITVEYVNAGDLSGKTQAIATITPKAVPNIAAHNGGDQNRAHGRTGIRFCGGGREIVMRFASSRG